MVRNHIYFRKPASGRVVYYNPTEVEVTTDEKGAPTGARLKADGLPVETGGIGTMSKSKNNGVDPQAFIDRYGADTARLFMMFAAPPELSLDWSDEGAEGAFRFLKRLWKAVHTHVSAGAAPALDRAALTATDKDLRRLAHQTLAKVGDDYGRRRTFNTAIAAVMELLNAVSRHEATSASARAVVHEALEIAVLVLSPVVPHITHTLWQALGHDRPLIDESWPAVDEEALKQDAVTLVVQVNGKLRGQITVAVDADEATVRAQALADPTIQRFVGELTVRKVIVVKGKLVNVVAA
jgi:leucyl-tRNA synthetase